MAKKNIGKPIMAGEVPHGVKEPAFVKMYEGCSIYSYTDAQEALRLVMFNKRASVRHGTKEALGMRTEAKMREKYNLELVREIGGQ
jgi:hypothetical protein